eukprot:scaffold27595_cov45-Attheya_sp.AAC.1
MSDGEEEVKYMQQVNNNNGRINDPMWDNMSVAASVTSASFTATSVAPISTAATSTAVTSIVVAVADDDPPNYPGVGSGTVSVDGFGEREAIKAVKAYIANHYIELMAVIPVICHV